MLTYLFVDADVYFEGKLQKLNLGISGSKISYIGYEKPEAKEEISMRGLSIFPGFIDSQVHFREPGLTHKEDIEHGSRGAALGGITGFFEMPNTKPPTISKETIQEKLNIADRVSFTNYAFYVGATKENITELDEVRKMPGVCGVKIFMGSSTGSLLLSEDSEIEKVMARVSCPIAVHSEDEDMLVERKHIAEDAKSVFAHPKWRSSEVAMSSTKRLISLAEKTNKKIHILHITTSDEIEYLRNKKHLCSFELTPQHLSLSAPDAYEKLGSFAQMNPPIREQSHTKALWKAVEEKTFDVFGSDHAPHTKEEKKKAYPESPSGMPGVQTMMPVLLTHVIDGKLDLETMVDAVTKKPAKVFGLREVPEIKEGNTANLSVFDLKTERNITHDWMENKSGWTPFDGFKAKAWPIHTLVNGSFAVKDEKLCLKHGKKYLFKHNLG